MAAKHARGLKPVPGVAKLDIMVIAATRQSVLTAEADISPSVRNAQNGYLKRRFKVSIKAERGISYFEARKIVTAESEGRSSLGRVAALQLLLLAPRVWLLVQLLSRLISHGLIDRNNPH